MIGDKRRRRTSQYCWTNLAGVATASSATSSSSVSSPDSTWRASQVVLDAKDVRELVVEGLLMATDRGGERKDARWFKMRPTSLACERLSVACRANIKSSHALLGDRNKRALDVIYCREVSTTTKTRRAVLQRNYNDECRGGELCIEG